MNHRSGSFLIEERKNENTIKDEKVTRKERKADQRKCIYGKEENT